MPREERRMRKSGFGEGGLGGRGLSLGDWRIGKQKQVFYVVWKLPTPGKHVNYGRPGEPSRPRGRGIADSVEADYTQPV